MTLITSLVSDAQKYTKKKRIKIKNRLKVCDKKKKKNNKE